MEIIRNAPPLAEAPITRQLYPFDKMHVGDAFDMARDLGMNVSGGDRRQASVHRAALRFVTTHRPDWKFRIRCLDRDTVRCQRIK